MRLSSCSVTARVRVSIWLEIASVRPSHRVLVVAEHLVERALGFAGDVPSVRSVVPEIVVSVCSASRATRCRCSFAEDSMSRSTSFWPSTMATRSSSACVASNSMRFICCSPALMHTGSICCGYLTGSRCWGSTWSLMTVLTICNREAGYVHCLDGIAWIGAVPYAQRCCQRVYRLLSLLHPVSDVNRESGAPEGRRLDRCILVERLTASAAVLASTPSPMVSIAFLSARLYSHLSPSQSCSW